MRWLTNFYDFSFKWTATAAIGLSQLMNFKNAIWTLEERYAIRFCFKLGKNAMRWKLDLLLWPRDQETEFPVEACWLSQTQEGQTEQIHRQTFDDPFFLTSLAWSMCTGFPPDRQSIRNSVQAFTIVVGLENSVCYCYTSYEMTDQFLWFQVQMNSYGSNWNTPY